MPEADRKETTRDLVRNDLYFLLRYVLGRDDIEREWLWERCWEVQEDPDGYLDLWAREHYKSTIITFAKTIQDILIDPKITCGIFSHTRPIAKGFLRQIKREFEGNEYLKFLFDDILWQHPQKEAPKWSEDDGIIVKREGNPKEATVEAWGIVDGQPTGKHFGLMVYDDLVTKESVTSPDMIKKTTEAVELSFNLGAEGGKKRFIGTRYHYGDTYRVLLDREVVTPRIYPATEDGTLESDPVLLTRERLIEKRKEQGPYTFASQMLQNPKGDETQGLLEDWLRYYTKPPTEGMNTYILCDPASSKKKTSDYTVFWVLGAHMDGNVYVLDMIRDRLNLTQRAKTLIELARRWKPMTAGYERYGMMGDIEYIKEEQERQGYRFEIVEVGGTLNKVDRIRRLIPDFEERRIYFPIMMYKTNYEGERRDLIQDFLNDEYKAFPVGTHDDMLDALSRMKDIDIVHPESAQLYEPLDYDLTNVA